MSNTMEQAYAEAFAELIKRGMLPSEVATNMRRVLEAEGRTGLLPKIARAYERIAAREEAGNTLHLSVAREKDGAHALHEAKKLLAEQGLGEFDLCQKTDDSLIGGWRLEGKGMLLDTSWKKSLLSMYNRSTI